MAKKNQAVEDNYDEDQEKANLQEPIEDAEEVLEKTSEGELYTYVGAGESPPQRIHFMGKQVFRRGVAVSVTNPEVLAKLPGHPCFVKGEVEQDAMYEADEEANKAADQQRQKDNKLNASVLKKMASWGKKGADEGEGE